ncbi:UDP-N-acetylmuramate--L-alanine ligase [Clostridia bacterium]|nr:UDP-N-acetylmuramate--L-alanine ligase [Clostridia bacterium]
MENIKRIHFVGIGGVSMSKLALSAKASGYIVTGSDLADGSVPAGLAEAGIRVFVGHRADNIGAADLVVVTAAVPADNPELRIAVARGIPVTGRAEFLGRLCDTYQNVVAVAGCHGKTTASGMIGYILQKAGLHPALHIGGALQKEERNGENGAANDKIMVVEACEYKRSFLHLRADFPVVLNVGEDHLDYYRDLRDIKSAFAAFLKNRRADGAVVANGDDRNTADVLKEAGCGAVTFGLDKGNDYRARNIAEEGGRFSFDLWERGKKTARITLGVPGRHNIYNALTASAVTRRMGAAPETVAAALWDFSGMKRRFEYRAGVNGAKIYHDYAHHPDEIAAVFRAARLMKPARLICVFQPHTYSRTKILMNEFVRVLRRADIAVIAEIYAAREQADPSVSGALLCERVRRETPACFYFPTFGEIRGFLVEQLQKGDLVLVLGAGNIDGLYPI